MGGGDRRPRVEARSLPTRGPYSAEPPEAHCQTVPVGKRTALEDPEKVVPRRTGIRRPRRSCSSTATPAEGGGRMRYYLGVDWADQTVQPVTAVLLPVKVRSRRPPRVPYSDTRLAGRATFPRESSGRKSSAAGERCLSRSDRSRRASNRAGRSKANTGGSVEMPPDRSRGRDCGGADSLV